MKQRPFRNRLSIVAATSFAVALVAIGAVVMAQDESAIYLLAIDRDGKPVLDVKASDIAIKEDVGPSTVLSVRRFGWPLRVTVLLDNGPRSASALVHYRTGLKKFFDGLPANVPVSLIATAPNPRWLIRETTDKAQIEKGVNLITPDAGFGRFSDALVEFAERLDKEFQGIESPLPPYLPVLVSIATTDQDGSEVRRDANVKMVNSLLKYRVWTTMIMISGGFGAAEPGGLPNSGSSGDGQNAQVAKALQELTGGRYVPITGSGTSALSSTILPELAQTITVRYIRQMTQHRIVFERASGATGQMKHFSLSLLNHPGATITLSTNGAMP